jgi:hypothetical protein
LMKITPCGALKCASFAPTGRSFPFPWSLIPFTDEVVCLRNPVLDVIETVVAGGDA